MIALEELKTRMKDRGPLRLQDILALGGHGQQVRRWVDGGDLVRLARGLYHFSSEPLGEYQSLIETAARSSKAVICLLSALRFHDLTTQNPREVWIALPQGARGPAWSDLSVRVIHLAPRYHESDVEIHALSGIDVKVYSIAKTLADCFRFRNLVGLDVALEALREALSERRVTGDALHLAARARGVEKTMRPYLEAL